MPPRFSRRRAHSLSFVRPSLRRPLALTVQLACAGLAVIPAAAAQAQQVAEAARSYDIPAGPLAATLARFVGESGIFLSGTAELAQGKSSPGLKGSFTASRGLAELLKGTELEAVQQPSGNWVLRESANDASATLLKAVAVKAQYDRDGTTEGSGSYTTRSTSTATGLPLSLRETPQSVTVFTRARIDDQGLVGVSQVLDQTVGVNFNGTSALGSDGVSFYSRGFEIKNFQVDGVPRPTTIYGFESNTLDLALYDRVEVVRGATGLLNGAGSPAATINLVRKRPTAETKGYVAAQAGSHDNYRLEADVGGALTESGNIRGRAVAAYQESDSYLDRAHAEKQVLYGIVDIDLTSSTLLSIGLEYQDFQNSGAPRGGLPLFFTDGSKTDFSRSTNVGADWSDFEHSRINLFATLEHQFDNGWSVRLDVDHSRPKYDETIGYLYGSALDPVTGSGGSLLSARWAGDLEQTFINVQGGGPFQLFGREHELLLGASHSVAEDEGDEYPLWYDGPDYWVPFSNAFPFLGNGKAPKPSFAKTGFSYGGRVVQDGAFAAVRLKPTEAVSVLLGARVSDWKETEWRKAAGASRTSDTLGNENGVVTPYAGVVVDLNENFSAYVSYTEIFEPQNIVDINARTLAPLEGINYEAGIKAEFNDGRLNASAAVFRIEQDNYGVALNIPAPDGKDAYRAENVVSQGFDVEVNGELLPGWQIGGGFSRAAVEDTEGKRALTNIPTETFKLFSSYRLPGAWEKLTLGGNLRWQNNVYMEAVGPNGEDFTQGNVATVDLLAKYAVSANLSVALNINNVFDKEYYSGLSYSGTYAEPRNLLLSGRYRF